MSIRMSPNQREVLSAISTITGQQEYLESTNGALEVTATITPSGTQDTNLIRVGGATISLGQTTMSASLPITIASNQTALPVSQSGNWSTRTQDGSGNAITSTGGALDINLKTSSITLPVSGTVSVTGVATASNQTSGAQLTQIVDAGGDAVTVTGGKLDVNATISGSGGGTSSIDDSAFVAATDSGTPMMGFATSDPVDSGDVGVLAMDTARNLKVIAQSNSGVDIGDVTVNNAAGAAAVNIQDGGNTITVDGAVTANAGTNLNTSALALAATQTDKSQFTKLTDGTDTALITASGEQNVIATAQPGVDIGDVTVNNGSGASAVNIQDGGNTITVDGTVAVTGVSTASNQTSGAQLTQIVDAGGEVVTVTGGKLDVNATISGSGGGTSSIDDSAFTVGSDSGTPAMGLFDDVAPDSVNEGDVGVLRMSANRNGYMTIRDAAGNERGVNVSAGNALLVDGSATTQPVSGTVTANAGTNLNTSALLTTTDFNNSFGTAGSADSQVRTIQGIASMTPVQVSQATASNLNATVVGAGSAGTANAGVMTVQGITSMTPLLVTPAANSAINIAQVNGATVNVGTGAAGTGTQRVTTSTDSTIGTVTTVTTLTGTTTLTPGTAAANLGKAEDAAHASGDTGVASWGVRNDNGATSYGADQDYAPQAVDASGRTLVTQKAATSTVTSVNDTASSTTLLSANSARLGATLYNTSTVGCYVKFGTTASATSFTVFMAASSYYEVPFGYTGRIDGIWVSDQSGAMIINEIT